MCLNDGSPRVNPFEFHGLPEPFNKLIKATLAAQGKHQFSGSVHENLRSFERHPTLSPNRNRNIKALRHIASKIVVQTSPELPTWNPRDAQNSGHGRKPKNPTNKT